MYSFDHKYSNERNKAKFYGDRVLNFIVSDLISKNHDGSHYASHHYYEILTSNKLIQHFKIGFKLPKNFATKTRSDWTEIYIYFLYCNYGIKRTTEYIIKQLLINTELIVQLLNNKQLPSGFNVEKWKLLE